MSEGQLKESMGQLEVSVGQLEGIEGELKGSESQLEGSERASQGLTDGQTEFLPILWNFVPSWCRCPKMKYLESQMVGKLIRN